MSATSPGWSLCSPSARAQRVWRGLEIFRAFPSGRQGSKLAPTSQGLLKSRSELALKDLAGLYWLSGRRSIFRKKKQDGSVGDPCALIQGAQVQGAEEDAKSHWPDPVLTPCRRVIDINTMRHCTGNQSLPEFQADPLAKYHLKVITFKFSAPNLKQLSPLPFFPSFQSPLLPSAPLLLSFSCPPSPHPSPPPPLSASPLSHMETGAVPKRSESDRKSARWHLPH